MFKQKFENFAVTPPEKVWNGVQAGIETPIAPLFIVQYWKAITAAVVVLGLVVAGILIFKPGTNQQSIDSENAEPAMISDSGVRNASQEEQDDLKQELHQGDITPVNNEIETTEPAKAANPVSTSDRTSSARTTLNNIDKNKGDNQPVNSNYRNTGSQIKIAGIESQGFKQEEQNLEMIHPVFAADLSVYSVISNDLPQLIMPSITESSFVEPDIRNSKGGWSIGMYFSPEMMLNNFDSIEMLTNYSINIEPTYFINDHLFVRFGLGASYSRDQGFANLDYLSNDLLGTYDHVYDITFDSIDGEVVPTYHTKTVEVWDTVRHLEISSLTNKYMYIQTPLLFGYYNTSNNFNWYFYGGPAFNLMVSKQIEKPLDEVEFIEVLDLNNKLPERSPYYFQLWVGAGIEYKVSNRMGISFEPNYRYYFNNVFEESPYSNTGLSGFSLRFGLIYTIQ